MDFAFFVANVARYLKNPSSSKKTERKVIEMNKTRIFNGLMLEFENNPSNISCGEIHCNSAMKLAPIRQTNQYVFTLFLKRLIFGKNKTERINNMQVITAIMIVANKENT